MFVKMFHSLYLPDSYGGIPTDMSETYIGFGADDGYFRFEGGYHYYIGKKIIPDILVGRSTLTASGLSLNFHPVWQNDEGCLFYQSGEWVYMPNCTCPGVFGEGDAYYTGALPDNLYTSHGVVVTFSGGGTARGTRDLQIDFGESLYQDSGNGIYINDAGDIRHFDTAEQGTGTVYIAEVATWH